MKVDLHKDFDSVHWVFLQDLLQALNFPPIFILWIMACITSVQFTIAINGQQGDFFKGKRGLKQGDPLSPLLFVLSMEYLYRLLKKTCSHPGFEYHPYCKRIGLSHLMFADDLVIFCKAKPHSLRLLMEAFNTFTNCTGLKANLDKSQIVFGGDCQAVIHECLDITGFMEGNLPQRYLGMPITASRLSKMECKTLVDKIAAKITTWSSRHISYAGRVVLINNVLMGMFSFWAKIFILP